LDQDAVGKIQKRIPCKDREGFPMGSVTTRTPAAKRIIVHAGQIIVDQREGVDELEACRETIDFGPRAVAEVTSEDGKSGTKPFATRKDSVAHGGPE
jgi:hypothetical protein